MAASFWSLRSFTLAHRRQDSEEILLDRVTLEVPSGGFYLLVGHSGGGKSSLMRLCAGLVDAREPLPRTAGEFECLGVSVREGPPASLQARIAAILQDEGLLDEITPRQNVELALRAADRSIRMAPALLAEVGLDPAPDRVASLSGGMRKRLAVARALAAEPAVLFCDEPVAGLDPEAARQIAQLLRRAHDLARQRTTVVVTHDVDAFAGCYDGVLELNRAERTLRLHDREFRWKAPPVKARAGATAGEGELVHGLRHGLLAFAGISHTSVSSLLRLPPVELGQVVRSVVHCVLTPMFFVAGASGVIGGLATFFALRNNPIEGGFESALLTGTGKVLLAVLVPLLCGFFFTARIAAGAAARLGTMTRTQQVSALRMMGVDPVDYLLTPLVWGMAIGLPIVTFAGMIAASFAGLLAAQSVSGITTAGWAQAWFRTVDAMDGKVVLLKSVSSGYLVALTCFHLGTGPKRSGAEVGDAVNGAIVLSMGLVLAVHAIATLLVYA
jgi:ABC-type multidrug transport system ATPase subunit/ABC-type transporter Mla maintaining outer membrane lipid asymmetry permease subunit MlaE